MSGTPSWHGHTPNVTRRATGMTLTACRSLPRRTKMKSGLNPANLPHRTYEEGGNGTGVRHRGRDRTLPTYKSPLRQKNRDDD